MKYKVGDKVRVREDLLIDKMYDGCYFTPSMTVFLGKTVTIRKVRWSINRYEIKEDHGAWNWNDEMFESLESEKVENKTMRYKAGDKVKVRGDLVVGKKYDGEHFIEDMTQYRGKIVTIDRVGTDNLKYLIKDDNHSYWWTDEMFKPLKSENPADETNDSEEWFLCRDDINKPNDAVKDVVHADAIGAAESTDCLLELKFKEAVRKITPDDLKRILLKKIEDSINNMSDDVIQDILVEALC